MDKLLQSVLHIEQYIREWTRGSHTCAGCLQGGKGPLTGSREVLMDAGEVMDYLGISRSTFFRLKKKGLLPHCKLGGRAYFIIRHLDEALAQSIRKGRK